MTRLAGKRLACWSLAGVLAMALSVLALEGGIRPYAQGASAQAAARFGGDRVMGLGSRVVCHTCALPDRDRVVWVLGDPRDPRALPVLKAHYTSRKCNHGAELCQYELGKAIMKIEGTWRLRSSSAFGRSRP